MPLSLISKLVVPDWISFLRSCNSIDLIFLSSFVISGFMEIPGLLASFAREDNIEVTSHNLLSLTSIGLCFVSEYFPSLWQSRIWCSWTVLSSEIRISATVSMSFLKRTCLGEPLVLSSVPYTTRLNFLSWWVVVVLLVTLKGFEVELL